MPLTYKSAASKTNKSAVRDYAELFFIGRLRRAGELEVYKVVYFVIVFIHMAPILQGTSDYYVYVLIGVNVNTLENLNYKTLGIKGFKTASRTFGQLLREVVDIRPMLRKTTENQRVSEYDLFYHFGFQHQSYVLYSTDSNALDKFLNFLMLIQPSTVYPWIHFGCSYYDYERENNRIREFRSNGLGVWPVVDRLENQHPLMLSKKDYRIANKLLAKYFSFHPSPRFMHLIGLYFDANSEKNVHFKYLLLFMILESLIDDTDKTSIVYKLKRMCAILVGDTPEICRILFKKVGEAYAVRSTLVHAGKSKVQNDLVQFVHALVCEVLIANMLMEPINSVFALTNESGYGDKGTLIQDRTLRGYTQLTKNRIALTNINTKIK